MVMFVEKKLIMDELAIQRSLKRITHEIIERNKGTEHVALVGIHRRGVPLAQRLARCIEQVEGDKPQVGVLDITYYRDDLSILSAHPEVKGTDIPFSVDGKAIVLVDDVLYTGRTARAAMEAAGITPVEVPIRGGTDGARLSYMGLPCPNLCTGGVNFHGVHEYIPAAALNQMAQVLVNLVTAQ